MISFEAGMLTIGALLISGPKLGAPDHHHGVMLGAAAGTLFGVSDVAVKALTGLGGLGDVLFSPWLAIAMLASVVAFYASARGMQQGEAVPVIAATSTAANVSCILGGIVVFGDPMPADTLGIVLQGVAFTMVILAALVTPRAGPRGRGERVVARRRVADSGTLRRRRAAADVAVATVVARRRSSRVSTRARGGASVRASVATPLAPVATTQPPSRRLRLTIQRSRQARARVELGSALCSAQIDQRPQRRSNGERADRPDLRRSPRLVNSQPAATARALLA